METVRDSYNQYIGARYVPKFFTNPNDGSNNWLANIEYEALTIVTDGYDSYTSKKPVPKTVGRPSENPVYWVCTSKYSAIIASLQNTVSDINTLIGSDVLETLANTIVGGVNELNDKTPFITPAMFGSKGDGISDDTEAMRSVIASNVDTIMFGKGTYLIEHDVSFGTKKLVFEKGAILKPANGATITIYGSVSAGDYEIFDASDGNIYLFEGTKSFNICWFDGASLNERWDRMRKSFIQNRPYVLRIPHPYKGENGAVESVEGREWLWKVTAPLYFNDPENCGIILCEGWIQVANNVSIDAVFDFSSTNKVENVFFPYGVFLYGNNTANCGIKLHAGSRIIFGGLVDISNFNNPILIESTTLGSVSGVIFNKIHLYNFRTCGVKIDGATYGVNYIDIQQLICESVANDEVIDLNIVGTVRTVNVNDFGHNYTPDYATPKTNIVIDNDATSAPRFITINSPYCRASVAGITVKSSISDNSHLSAYIIINNPNVSSGSRALDIDYAFMCTVNNLSSDFSAVVGTNAINTAFNNTDANITDDGVRTTFNGTSFKALNGATPTGRYAIGTHVFDTDKNVEWVTTGNNTFQQLSPEIVTVEADSDISVTTDVRQIVDLRYNLPANRRYGVVVGYELGNGYADATINTFAYYNNFAHLVLIPHFTGTIKPKVYIMFI